jgi:hypothetical protein
MSKYVVGDTVRDGWGRSVRIVCVDMVDPSYPVVGLVMLREGGETPGCYTAEGRVFENEESEEDLI